MSSSHEATFICVDNSDYNRNEDVLPNRFMSQIDCINVICCNRTSINYENHIGILVMAGRRIKVKAALTNDVAKLLSCINDIKIEGTCDVLRSLSIAQLALKQRVNKNLKQKIVLFIASPVVVKETQLLSTAKQLKKNNICVDIISIGHVEENREVLKKLYENVNNDDNCKYVEVPLHEDNLSKYVLSSIAEHSFSQVGGGEAHGVDDSLTDLQMLNGNPSPLGGVIDSDARGGTNNVVGLPTEEDIVNMRDIDPDLRNALLVSLREYNESYTPGKEQNENQEEQNQENPSNDNKDGETKTEGTNGITETNDNEMKSEEKQNRKRQNECISIGSESYKNVFDLNDNVNEHEKEKKENECFDKAFKMIKTENGKNIKYENTDASSMNPKEDDKNVIANNDMTLSENQVNQESENKESEGEEKERTDSKCVKKEHDT